MPLPIHSIDAFVGEDCGGNLAGVVFLDRPLADAERQRIARDFGASETAFIEPEGDHFRLRWFTPTMEVDLCGHGTLASAHALWELRAYPKDQPIHFETLSGRLTCRRTTDGRIELDFPELTTSPAAAEPGLLEALGITVPVFVGKSGRNFLIEVPDAGVVTNLAPRFEELQSLQARGVFVTARSSDPRYHFVSRCFFPKEGIPEDPVTGSAHCALGPYWRERLGKPQLTAKQASRSGGEIRIRFTPSRVILGGLARIRN